MAFPARSLREEEQVVVDSRPHGWVLSGPVALAVVAVAAGGVGVWAHASRPVAWLLVGVVVLAVANLLGRYARWRSTSLVVTTQRVVRRRGVLSRSRREIPLFQVTDVSYRQGLLQRLVRAGDLRIESAGRDSAEVVPAVPRPAAVEGEILRLVAEGRAGGPGLSLPEQLDRLVELSRRGVLTPEELEVAKARLLRR